MQAETGSTRRGSTSERLKPAPVITSPVTFHYEIQSHMTRMQKLTKAFSVYRLMARTLVCVIAGIAVGLICRPYAEHWTERQFMYIEIPGELYLRFLKLIIIPLLVSNVILSFGTIQGKISSKLVKVAGLLYLACNVIAVIIAILVATIMCPGCPRKTIAGKHEINTHIMNGFNTIGGHHYFREYHDSIARYREYHPLFYHTNISETEVKSGRQYGVSATRDNQTSGKQRFRGKSAQIAESHDAFRPEEPPCGSELLDLEDEDIIEISQQVDSNNTDIDIERELAHLVRSVDENPALAYDVNRIGLNIKLPIDVVLDVLRNLVPDSLVGATLQQSRTRLFTPKELRIEKNGSTSPPPSTWPMGHETVDQPNIIGLLAMSVMTGVVLSHMGEASKPLLDLCSCVSELSLRIGMGAIQTAPFCIMFLLIGQIARARDLSSIAGELMMYVVTVILALFVYGLVVLPLVYYVVTRRSPYAFCKGLFQALVAAFATSSSSATVALVLNCLDDLDVNIVIVRAFGPLGSVFNMNGTSIFEAVAVIFIAQTLGVHLGTTSLLLIGLCSAIASLSTSGIPSAGVMTLVIVLNAINLPVLELSLIYIVDFIVDRFRTVLNVWSGAIVCGLIDHICPEELFEEEMAPEKYREMIKYRGSRTSLTSRKSCQLNDKPQVISVTITPP